ncbi:MAG TPA: exodeoxyribonuclease VII small subunit [Aestuariivirgaceae bacterium]|jgi:exodeoxyribonuclease VII small subunit
MADAPHGDIAAMSFEVALKELEDIVGRLEQGRISLEESISIYERGERLKAHCEKLLNDAEARIDKITLRSDGTPQGSEPFNAE